MSPASRQLLTAREVQQILKIRRDTFYRALRAGRVPAPIRLTGATGHPRWRADVIDAWLASQSPSGEQGGIS